jgi:hypothetical protein
MDEEGVGGFADARREWKRRASMPPMPRPSEMPVPPSTPQMPPPPAPMPPAWVMPVSSSAPRGLQEANQAQAFQAAWEAGWKAGRDTGWQEGWDTGFKAGRDLRS